MARISSSLILPAVLLSCQGTLALPRPSHNCSTPYQLHVPSSAEGASIEHVNTYASFSFEPAFWVEFVGNHSDPNRLTFDAIDRIIERGGQPIFRPGGITMDSMIFDPEAGDPVRTTSEEGGVYRTTVGPAFYESWSNFPEGTKFVSTLNFGNESLEIARDMAVASARYQSDKILYYELGNEPTNYGESRWNGSTEAYINQWHYYTGEIDHAVNEVIGAQNASEVGTERWWASSATTDETSLDVRPADLIPLGIDARNQVGEYSIHSYAFATCDPEREALATIPNLLNHTDLVRYADEELYPSARAALDEGKPIVIGEFNSIACSGKPNVSDTFANALWTVDVELLYATRNFSGVYLHQGATLVFQSDEQLNEGGEDGGPTYSTYSILYPRDSNERGPARTLPGFVSQLFIAEVFATPGIRVRSLETPEGVSEEGFASYALYADDALRKMALVNTKPFYANSTSDYTVTVELPSGVGNETSGPRAWVKRMTAPYVDTGNSGQVTWAGQSFEDASAYGQMKVEEVGDDGLVSVRGSEAVLVFFDRSDVYGLDAEDDCA